MIDRLVISRPRHRSRLRLDLSPSDDEYNIGCGVVLSRRGPGRREPAPDVRRFVATFPEAREVIRAAIATTPLKGALLRCGLSSLEPPRLPRVLSIGETIGTTFPFTGEGIGKAMETGELAAEALGEALDTDDPGCLDRFPSTVKAVLEPKYLGYRSAERWLARPWVTDLLAWRARRSRFLRSALPGILNETIDPRTVFSIGGLARSLFR